MSAPIKIECVDCAKLPTLVDALEASLTTTVQLRPRAVRKIDPRSLETHKTQPRCTTHWLAWRNTQRAKSAAARSRKRSGLDDETRQAVKDLQGNRCPCGAPLLPKSGKRIEPDADHCHELALTHDHPEEVACEECFRGFLCRHCNREVIGFFTQGGTRGTAEVITALRGLADYLEDWPMRQWLRQRSESCA
jgi:hypothetical protein